MTRRPFGWDLPPGVTQRMIDDAVSNPNEELLAIGEEIEILEEIILCLNKRMAILYKRLDDIKDRRPS